MANIPEEIATGFVTQLTRVITDGISVFVPRVTANGGDSQNVVMPNGISESTTQGMGSGIMANSFSESVTTNGVSEPVSQGIGVRVMANGVSDSVSQDMVNNGVSESIPQSLVNGARANGVSVSVLQGMVNGVRDNGVSEPILSRYG
ncbi:hypothetical protein Tco_1059080 [Tanacetum coccineum]